MGAVYFFYVDESGTLDCKVKGTKADGTTFEKDPIYVLTAVSLFDGKWRRFERALNGKKRELCRRIVDRDGGNMLDLADCEVKSTSFRIPKQRNAHKLLRRLYDPEIQELVDAFYAQLQAQQMRVLSIVVDKRQLHDYMDQAKLHRKAWELLLERVEGFLSMAHPKHLGVLVTDDVGKSQNRSLAMKHAYLLEMGSSAGRRLKHIAEMPLFVRSELSNGVQLADLVSYNVYRAFKYQDFGYDFFRRVMPSIWCSDGSTPGSDGLKVFPPESALAHDCADVLRKVRESLA